MSGSAANKWLQPNSRKRSENQTETSITSKENAVVQHIKAYYTEVMDQVNERYQNSFKNDPYLNINIELVGFYIAMVRETFSEFLLLLLLVIFVSNLRIRKMLNGPR